MEIRAARNFEFELPVGYVDDDGRVHRTAVLRKMTGHEEALLADRKLRQNGGKLITELLAGCLRRLGELEPVARPVIARLSSADRNYLLLELRKITFGTELTANYTCPHCGETTSALEDLDELPVRRADAEGGGEIVVELADGYEDKEGQVYTSMVFRLPIGTDEEKVAGVTRDNPSHGMNALLTRCLTTLGDMPDARREALGTRLLADLTMADRARIDQAFRRAMPGVDLLRDVECCRCGRRYQINLDFTSFFSLQ